MHQLDVNEKSFVVAYLADSGEDFRTGLPVQNLGVHRIVTHLRTLARVALNIATLIPNGPTVSLGMNGKILGTIAHIVEIIVKLPDRRSATITDAPMGRLPDKPITRVPDVPMVIGGVMTIVGSLAGTVSVNALVLRSVIA